MVESAEESCATAKLLFEKLTIGGRVPAIWREGNGIPVDVIAAEAGCADLVILGRDDNRGIDAGFYPVTPADIILTCGRPVLVFPEQPPSGAF